MNADEYIRNKSNFRETQNWMHDHWKKTENNATKIIGYWTHFT